MAEHFTEHPAEPAEYQPRHPFEVGDTEVYALAPSVNDGVAAFKRALGAFNPEQPQSSAGNEADAEAHPEDAPPQDEPAKPTYGREAKRKSQNIYASHLGRVIRTGANYLASFDSEKEGIEAGRDIFAPVLDSVLGDIYTTRIQPAAGPLRQLRTVAHQVGEEVTTLAADESRPADRYTLMKALAQFGKGKEGDEDEKLSLIEKINPTIALSALCTIGNVAISRQLASEAQTGLYDRYIVHDVLRYVDSEESTDNEYARLEQLVNYLKVFVGDDPAALSTLRNRMAETYTDWPPAQLQVISEARQTLLSRLDLKTSIVNRAMREDNLTTPDDPKEAFQHSLDLLSEEMLRRVVVTPANKAQIMKLRAEKRGRLSRRATRNASRQAANATEEVAATVEERREPLKIVSCNLNDFSVGEDVEAMIDEFVKNTSQGNVTLRQDVERMISFMARTDLPPTHRRGVKAINGQLVKFGVDDDPDKLWDFFEFKPSDAAGLPTKTSIAKNLRIYFIKYEPDTLGVIGIKPRSEQDNFLRSIRVKNKRRD